MKLHRLILCTILSISVITISNAQEKKAIKGFSGGMMVPLDTSLVSAAVQNSISPSISERYLRDISQLLPSVKAFKAEATTNYSGQAF